MSRIRSPGPDQEIIPRKIAHHEGSTEGECQKRNPIAQLTGAELQIKTDSNAKAEPSEDQHLPGDHRGQGVQTGTHPGRPADTDSHQRRDHHQEEKQKAAPRKQEQVVHLELQARPKKAPEALVKSSGHARRQRNPDQQGKTHQPRQEHPRQKTQVEKLPSTNPDDRHQEHRCKPDECMTVGDTDPHEGSDNPQAGFLSIESIFQQVSDRRCED